LGILATDADASLFTMHTNHVPTYLLVYVDDILIAGKGMATINTIKEKLSKAFDVRDLGEAALFLSMTIKRDRGNRTLSLTHERAMNSLL
jgi:hypothetical protein